MYQGEELLLQIKLANLLGRGGADFPADKKWRRIGDLNKPKKYVVCNAGEGEPGVHKDYFLLEHHPEQVIAGQLLAMDFLGTREGYLSINSEYYRQLRAGIDAALAQVQSRGYQIHLFLEKPSYIGGESSSMLNAIEGKPTQPRPKHPSPSVLGIFGCPTLVHNVETLYDIYRVATETYEPDRLCTITGAVSQPGVYRVANEASVEEILRQTGNYPPGADFFVQVGGGASGEVLTREQASEAKLSGCGSIGVYAASTTSFAFLKTLFNFYAKESCGKCMPCFKGSADLATLINGLNENSEIPWPEIARIVQDMKRGSFCALGTSIVLPVRSYAQNILGLDLKKL